jgi:hypothetical protein
MNIKQMVPLFSSLVTFVLDLTRGERPRAKWRKLPFAALSAAKLKETRASACHIRQFDVAFVRWTSCARKQRAIAVDYSLVYRQRMMHLAAAMVGTWHFQHFMRGSLHITVFHGRQFTTSLLQRIGSTSAIKAPGEREMRGIGEPQSGVALDIPGHTQGFTRKPRGIFQICRARVAKTASNKDRS